MADFTLQALHDEIENDTEAIGYKEGGGAWKADSVIADLINTKNYTIDVDDISMESARAITTYDAYNNLQADEQEWSRWMTPNSGLFKVTADMKMQLTGRTLTSNGVAGTGSDNASFWGASDRAAMCAAFLDLIEVSGSRAEVLWGSGKTVSILEVAYAANL